MASNCSLCGVCDNRQMAKFAVVWCSECDEGLCEDCKEHHSISKDGKNHGTYSITKHKKLPSEILQTARVCKIHNEEYKFFCTKHDCPCCKKCKKSHKDCKALTDINEIIQEVKTSNAFREIEQTLQEVDGLIKELMVVHQQESSKIQNILTSLDSKEKEITELQVFFDNIKQKASDLQAFLTMKEIEKGLADEEKKNIQSIANSGITNKVNISCQISQLLQQITSNVSKFGDINVSSDPCQLFIHNRKDRQAQIMLAVPTRNISNLVLTLQKHIDTKLSDVQGCSLLPKGRMVFSCYEQDKIRVHKSNGSKDYEINDIGKAVDVVFIGDGCIAVTSGHSNKIINSDNYGAVYKDGHLIYCAAEKGLKMISLSDESITNVTRNKLTTWSYVTLFGRNLIYTNPDSHTVSCCDYDGNILWTFCDKSVLCLPRCISVDKDGNIYAVGNLTHNVVVISPGGQRYRQLLSRDDGLSYPNVLHYDISTNKLLVANAANDAFVYDVK
ncbi:unnamed protein product [Mytilus edulis]|uniref:B box-type domain-containing protein n=1 Tax=Mytilus edulis TaxID=6550 RepID=A0A8S3URL4_MYTED|nr:unnamed protein product [Mytilus edulis]